MAATTTPSDRSLEGKVAIVTGASRGIGAAVCEILASKGCSLVMNYSSDSSAEASSRIGLELESKYRVRVVQIQADMGSEIGPANLINSAKSAFESSEKSKFQIDIVINNAGTSGVLSIEESDVDSFATMYNVNVRGPMLLVKAALPYLPYDRSGRIINVSSIASALGISGLTIYGGTKAALESMTRTWSRELAERATVNSINPGPVATEMYRSTPIEFQAGLKIWNEIAPLAAVREGIDSPITVKNAPLTGGRPADVQEIAGVVAMLCSSEAGWTTGSSISANGGLKFSY